jgi:excisionase family DNA binding protein
MVIEIKDNALFTLDELSKLLGLSKYTLRARIREGRLRSHKLGRGLTVWGADLREFINSQGRGNMGGFSKCPNPQAQRSKAKGGRR